MPVPKSLRKALRGTRRRIESTAYKVWNISDFERSIYRTIGIGPIGTTELKKKKEVSSIGPIPPVTRGFQTRHLRKVAQIGTSTQQTRAREQMRRLGRRMRSRGVDF